MSKGNYSIFVFFSFEAFCIRVIHLFSPSTLIPAFPPSVHKIFQYGVLARDSP